MKSSGLNGMFWKSIGGLDNASVSGRALEMPVKAGPWASLAWGNLSIQGSHASERLLEVESADDDGADFPVIVVQIVDGRNTTRCL